MYRKNAPRQTSMVINQSTEGETIEQKVERIVNNGEPSNDGSETIYTERGDGVIAGYDIRTDRLEVAIEGTDKIHRAEVAKREASIKKLYEKEEDKKVTGGESTQGQGDQSKDSGNTTEK